MKKIILFVSLAIETACASCSKSSNNSPSIGAVSSLVTLSGSNGATDQMILSEAAATIQYSGQSFKYYESGVQINAAAHTRSSTISIWNSNSSENAYQCTGQLTIDYDANTGAMTRTVIQLQTQAVFASQIYSSH